MFFLRLLGGLHVEGNGAVLTGRAAQRRRLALLAILGAAPTRTLSRDKLVALLWPESDTERARHQLASCVYDLRQVIGDAAILALGDELRLNPERIGSDVWIFEQALTTGDLQRAAAIYTGPLLDGFFLGNAPEFERWVDAERDRLSRLYAKALEQLAEEREAEGDRKAAAEWWRRLAVHDPFNSRITLRLVQALASSGDPAGALQHLRIHQLRLREELGIEPDSEVNAFAERLRLQSMDSGSRTDGSFSGAASNGGGLSIPADPAYDASGLPRNPGVPQIPAPPRSPDGAAAGPLPDAPILQSRSDASAQRWWIAAAAIPLLALASGAIWFEQERVSEPSIAVLSFKNESGDSADAYFADGITDDLLTHLSRISSLRVTRHNPATADAGTVRNLQEIADELDVEYVVTGEVRRRDSWVRVTARLIDTRTNRHLWGETHDRELTDIFAVQSDVAAGIARALELRLSPVQRNRIAAGPTRDFAAYELYLRGRYFWNKRTASDLAKAIEYFQQALERDPSFAAAHAGLADSYILLPPYSTVSPQEAYPKAKAAALRALELDGTLANAYTSLAYVHFWYDWDWKGAERAFRRATEIDPSYPTAHHWYAEYLATMGRFEEAFAEARRAQVLDPLSLVIQTDAGAIALFARREKAAVEQLQKALEMDSVFGLARWYLGMAYAQQGKYDAAIVELERAVRLTGSSDLCRMYLAHTYAISGKRAEASRILDDLREQSLRRKVNPSAFGFIYAGLGDHDEAFRWLEKAVEERSIVPHALTMHGQLDPLRSDPRYLRLLRLAGLR